MSYLYLLNMLIQEGNPGLPGGDPDAPIDQGLLLLLLVTTLYGCYKIKKMQSD
jgi:hypothetical protein